MKSTPTHIALADDEKRIRQTVSLMLRRAGYQVSIAETGEQLLSLVLAARATDSPVDLVLCDINMPGISGQQVLKELNTSGTNMPVIMMTGLSDDVLIAEFEAAGCNYFLFKPFTPEELLATVAKANKWE